MNILYGILALVLSLAVSHHVSKKAGPKKMLFAWALVLEFLAISVLGAVFYFLKLGFFGDNILDAKEIVFRIFGFAGFLAVLVAMKVVNQTQHHEHKSKSENV